MNKQELIKKYEYMNHDCFRRVDVSEVLADLRQLDEPKQIKLKDVIVRMEGLSEHTRSEWLNDILYKFGSDYGTLKYKDGYEQGKLEGSMIPYEEPQKVTIPQFVADWIEYCKKHNFTLFGCLDPLNGFESLVDEIFEGDVRKCIRWCRKESNNFARAWLDGYEVEKEKRYLVKMKGVDSRTNYLYYGVGSRTWLFKTKLIDGNFRKSHTRKELEQDNFGWVFDCEGIELEEVKE